MKHLFKIFLAIGLLTFSAIAYSQDVRFKRLQVEKGWADTYVYVAYQDKQGFLWFGTRNGLSKYDGAEIITYQYDPTNPNSLNSNYVWSLFQDSSGTFWVGTLGGGLNKFDPVHEKFTHYRKDPNNPDSISEDIVSKIYEDHLGVLWIATDGGGLEQFDQEQQKFIHYRHDPNDSNSLSSNNVSSVVEDGDNNLWVSTYAGLNKFDRTTNTFKRYLHDDNNPDSLSDDSIWRLYIDHEGSLWIGTEGGGLDLFDPINERFIHHRHSEDNPNSLSHDNILSIYEDNFFNLWIGTYGGGLNHFDRKHQRFTHYRANTNELYGLSNDEVWSIIGDTNNTLWISTSNGVNKYDPSEEKFAHFQNNPKNNNTLSHNQVSSFSEDSDKVLWIGTKGGGLNRLDRVHHRFSHYRHEKDNSNSLIDDMINALISDTQGILWIATPQGLDKFDTKNNTFKHYQHTKDQNSVGSNTILSLAKDQDGILWIGQDGSGLDRFDPVTETFKHYTYNVNDPNSLASDWVMVVYVDSNNTIWIGCSGGLSHLDPVTNTFTNYFPSITDSNTVSSTIVNTIYEDSRGYIWIGTNDGLNKFDRKTNTFKVYRDKQGLKSNGIASIVEDLQGYLWISTEEGLSKFDPQQETFRNYDQWDGLQSNQFSPKSAYISASGEIFFGGKNGFNVFYPDKLTDNTYVPPVILTDFQLFNKSISVGENSPLKQHINIADHITLTHDQSVFSFKFAALSYRAPLKNQYAYLMEGVDREWVQVGSQQRFATYTRLSPGAYTFKVKASNNDGIWNEQGAAIQITILPPWWKTWWAYSFYTILIFGSLILLFLAQQRKIKHARIINERLQHLDKLKDQFLANTSHELRTPLNGIIGIAESLLDGVAGELSHQIRENLNMIASSGKRLASLVNDILDFSKLKHQNLILQFRPVNFRATVDVVFSLSQLSVKNKRLKLINAIEEDLPPVKADENRLQQILHNLIGNAIKFTDKGEITVTACYHSDPSFTSKEKGYIEISVTDTGIGIPESKFDQIFESFEQADGTNTRQYGGTGLGLAVTKQLVKLHGGEIKVESIVGVGSRFFFTLPIVDKGTSFPPIIDRAQSSVQTEFETEIDTIINNNILSENKCFTILIVDDEPVNLRVLRNYLSLQNYNIIQATSGLEAIEQVEQGVRKPDIILLDIMMPKMTGYEVIERLRKHWQADELPIILLTAKNQLEDLMIGLNCGANDYLIKPIVKDELLVRIKNYLNIRELQNKTLKDARENERRLKQFLDTMPIGMVAIEPDGNLRFLNQMAKQLLSIDNQSTNDYWTLVASHFYLAGTQQRYPVERLTATRALKGESSTIDDIEIQLAGKVIPLESRGTPIFDQTGQIVYGLETFQDISDRKTSRN